MNEEKHFYVKTEGLHSRRESVSCILLEQYDVYTETKIANLIVINTYPQLLVAEISRATLVDIAYS